MSKRNSSTDVFPWLYSNFVSQSFLWQWLFLYDSDSTSLLQFWLTLKGKKNLVIQVLLTLRKNSGLNGITCACDSLKPLCICSIKVVGNWFKYLLWMTFQYSDTNQIQERCINVLITGKITSYFRIPAPQKLDERETPVLSN